MGYTTQKNNEEHLLDTLRHYVELTSLSEADIEYITQTRFSPVKILVLVANQKFLEYMHRLRDARITMNFLVVVLKGVNDGEHLERTIATLGECIPFGRSLGIALGAECYAQGEHYYTAKDCSLLLDTVEAWNAKFLQRHDTAFVYAADDIYLRSGRGLPSYEYYENFAQIENGIGGVASLMEEFGCSLDDMEPIERDTEKGVCVVTGMQMRPIISRMMDEASERLRLHISVLTLGEEGGSIAMATGLQLLQKIEEHSIEGPVIIPSTMLRGDSFLCGTSLRDLEATLQSLNCRLDIVVMNGVALCHALHSHAMR